MAFSKPKKELEYRFLLVGKSGSGKSSTANNIMGEELFGVSLGLSSGTKTCEVRKSSKPRKGVTFRIVDTPGLFDPTKSNEEIREEIIKAATYLHPGLHAVLYVLQVDRYTPEERSTFNLLKNLFDENIVKYVIIIFTRGDELKRNGKSLQSLLDEACEPFKEVVLECGPRVLVFNNIKRNQTETKNLLEMVDRIQKNNGDIPYSCPLQNHVNVELQRRVTIRTQEKINRDPELKRAFDEMAEDTRNAGRELDDATKHVEDIESKKEMTETMIVKLRAKGVEEQDMTERERAEIEKQERTEKEGKSLEQKKKEEEEHEEKKREEERESRRKEEERKAEEERERKKEKEELEKKRKECEELQRQLYVSQKVKEEKQKIKKKYEEKMEKEREKLEAKEKEQTKEDVAQGKEQHWIGQVAGGLWRGARGYLGF